MKLRTPLALLIALGLAATSWADPKWDAEVKRINGHFQTLQNHIDKADWRHPRTEGTAQTYFKRLQSAIQLAAKRFPQQKAITDRMAIGAQKMAQKVMAKMAEAKKAAAAPKAKPKGPPVVGEGLPEGKADSMVKYYEGIYKAAGNLPYDINAASLAGQVSALESFDLVGAMKSIEEDSKLVPELFKYYGMENKQGKYADLAYGGRQKPLIKHQGLKKMLDFYIPKIYEAKARFVGKEDGLVGAVQKMIDESKTLDEAVRAQRLAKACLQIAPNHAGVQGMIAKTEANVSAKADAVAHLVTGEFHKKNFKRIVAFRSQQTLGSEDPSAEVKVLTLGEPIYLVGYLSQDVASLGWKKHQSDLGYKVATYPNLAFQLEGNPLMGQVPTRSKLKGSKVLSKYATIEIPLIPDPDGPTMKSHLDYSAGLHFLDWLAQLPNGRHTLRLGLAGFPGTDPEKPGAFTQLPLEVSDEGKAKLAAFKERLWKKKLSTVVFPDAFGIEDRKGHLPNLSDLEKKHGKVLRLSMAQTGKVMKPWPLQHQIDYHVGLGYAALENDGKISIVGLGFRRKPAEPTLRWTALSGVPSHGTVNFANDQYGPKLHHFGYEILPENVTKTGEW